MPASNPLDILLQHARWATQQLIAACEKLSAEQLDRPFDIGVKSLRATITHIIGAMRAWTDTLAQRPQRPRPETSGVAYSIPQLRTMHDEAATELFAIAHAHPVDQTLTRERDGKQFVFTRGAILTHVTTHAMHHRAQALNMLKQLGVSPLPLSSVTEWTRFGEGGL